MPVDQYTPFKDHGPRHFKKDECKKLIEHYVGSRPHTSVRSNGKDVYEGYGVKLTAYTKHGSKTIEPPSEERTFHDFLFKLAKLGVGEMQIYDGVEYEFHG